MSTNPVLPTIPTTDLPFYTSAALEEEAHLQYCNSGYSKQESSFVIIDISLKILAWLITAPICFILPKVPLYGLTYHQYLGYAITLFMAADIMAVFAYSVRLYQAEVQYKESLLISILMGCWFLIYVFLMGVRGWHKDSDCLKKVHGRMGVVMMVLMNCQILLGVYFCKFGVHDDPDVIEHRESAEFLNATEAPTTTTRMITTTVRPPSTLNENSQNTNNTNSKQPPSRNQERWVLFYIVFFIVWLAYIFTYLAADSIDKKIQNLIEEDEKEDREEKPRQVVTLESLMVDTAKKPRKYKMKNRTKYKIKYIITL